MHIHFLMAICFAISQQTCLRSDILRPCFLNAYMYSMSFGASTVCIPVLQPRRLEIISLKFSEKSYVYALALQLLLYGGASSITPALCGLFIGSLYRMNIMALQDMRMPARIHRCCALLHPLFRSSRRIRIPLQTHEVRERNWVSPSRFGRRMRGALLPTASTAITGTATASNAIGSRLRTQSQQQQQQQQQQMFGSSLHSITAPPAAAAALSSSSGISDALNSSSSSNSSVVNVDASAVRMLVSMGFDDRSAVTALHQCGGDVSVAANRLLLAGASTANSGTSSSILDGVDHSHTQ
jgi:UBA/TS-N domain